MKQIMIVGFGNMGQRIAQAIEESSDMEIAYIVKENNQPDMEKLPDRIDAVIDFSHPNHSLGCLISSRKSDVLMFAERPDIVSSKSSVSKN